MGGAREDLRSSRTATHTASLRTLETDVAEIETALLLHYKRPAHDLEGIVDAVLASRDARRKATMA